MPIQHITTSKWLRSLLIIAFCLTALGSMTAFEVIDCRPQAGKPADQTYCSSILGGPGDQQITIEKDQTVTGAFFGDGVIGVGGNDTIINNGTTVSEGGGTGRNGDIEGDVATGNGGDDIIVNNGTVAGDMDGDTALANGGNDVIINNGTVGDDMDGDNARKNGGDDLIINNGTVGGDIEGDDNEGNAGSVGGNDTIVINGTVEGSVAGDFGVNRGGDDVVMLQDGANGGTDHKLDIDGNGGSDTLIFAFIVPDQAALDALNQQITDAKPARGSLTFNDQTFEWVNFEQIENQVTLAGMTSSRIHGSSLRFFAATNYTKDASVTLYCTTADISVLGTDRTGKNEFLFSVEASDVTGALQQAATDKKEIQVAVTDGQSMWALPSGELSMNDSYARYHFTFSCTGIVK